MIVDCSNSVILSSNYVTLLLDCLYNTGGFSLLCLWIVINCRVSSLECRCILDTGSIYCRYTVVMLSLYFHYNIIEYRCNVDDVV